MSELEKDPYLPKLIMTATGQAPKTPSNVQATGIDRLILVDLAIKTAHTVPHFTIEWASKRMLLPQSVVADLVEELRNDMLLEVKGQDAAGQYRYAISQRGREQAERSRNVSGYVGPAPVSLEAYWAMLKWQMVESPRISPEMVRETLANLVLTDEVMEVAGLAISSGRSIFLSGPPGNGKTTMGRTLHSLFQGDLWIPHCIAVENNIIRLFDPHCHQVLENDPATASSIDQRWVRIRRPLIVAGGEMTLESLDLAYNDSLRYYEAPLHMKANGGTFLIDDFGRQRVAPEELLNRWIIPLEHRIDFLSLHSGQKIEVPFMLMLIIATNLNPQDVTDPAFLRRIGYRIALTAPTPERYEDIFRQYAARYGVTVEPELMKWLLDRYSANKRELRSCEPRDLIERVRDICQHHNRQMKLDRELLDTAWKGYFGADNATAAGLA